MNLDPLLEKFVQEIRETHGCHTAILYGSRARGDFNDFSDYDLMGVRKGGEKYREARLVDGFYLDLFIWPEDELKEPSEDHLYMKDGLVLFESASFGTNFLVQLKNLYRTEPKKLPKDEKEVRKVWFKKMLDRARLDDIEGKYRATWLLFLCLEDYFLMRDLRFEGSKASFKWLQDNDQKIFRLYQSALDRPTQLNLIEALAENVYRDVK